MSKIITCPNCFQKNIVPNSIKDSLPSCRKCHKNLSLIKIDKVQSSNSWFDYIGSIIKLIALGTIVWILLNSGYLEYISSLMETTSESDLNQDDVPLQKVPALMNSTIEIYTNQPRVAPFEIQTSGSGYYLVKLVRTGTDDLLMTIFIHAGQSVTTEVPLGSYDVKYASGETWYGYEDLFGAETEYSKADSIFHFQDTGYQISGYTITLYQVTNGNLSTSEISASDF